MKRLTTILSTILFPILLALSIPPSAAEPSVTNLPGILRQSNGVFLMENHNVAYLIWHAQGIRNATLVHVDAHDDCRWTTPERTHRLSAANSAQRYDEIFRLSDLDGHFRYQVRQDDFFFDLGNFIYPCLLDGTVSTVWWVIPNQKLSPQDGLGLQAHLQSALKLEALNGLIVGEHGFSFQVGKASFHVTTPEGLPEQPPGALLDIDADFFLLDRALSETHLRKELLWDPETTCRLLRDRVPHPATVTVCASVWGGYLPLFFRFIPEAVYQYYSAGVYPPYARDFLSAVIALRRNPYAVPLPPEPADPAFAPAWQHMAATMSLSRLDIGKAASGLARAAGLSPIYAKAFLDSSEALLHMGRPRDAMAFVDRYEAIEGQATTHSDAARIRICLALGDLAQAERLSGKLVDWHRSSHSITLRAGVLAECGRYQEAETLYTEALREGPGRGFVYYNIGLLLEKQARTNDAVQRYQQALAFTPDFADARDNLGHLLLALRQAPDAIIHLARAVELDPFRLTALNNLGLALIRTGRPFEAIAHLERAAILAPESATSQANLGLALAGAGRPTEAAARYRRALALRPGWKEVEAALQQLNRASPPPKP